MCGAFRTQLRQKTKVGGVAVSWVTVTLCTALVAMLALLGSGVLSPVAIKVQSCERLGLWCIDDDNDARAMVDAELLKRESQPPAVTGQPDNRNYSRPDWRYSGLGGIGFQGVVENEFGSPIEGVEVRPRGSTFVLATTDARGEFAYTATPNTATVLYLSKPGFRLTTVSLRAPADPPEDGAMRRMITMTASGDAYAVEGYVIAQERLPVGAVTALLQSHRIGTRYEVSVDEDGYYKFPAVEASDDYRLRIGGAPNLRTILRGPLAITGPTTLAHSMYEALRTANLELELQDTTGHPIANQDFEVVIESNKRIRKTVTTGHDGMVRLFDVPEGRISLLTRSNPRLEVTGVGFSAKQDESLALTLVTGERELTGRVIDSNGAPVAGAEVEISGSERHGEATSRFAFRTVTDNQGEFRFDRLAQARHELRVRTNHHDSIIVDVGPQESSIMLVLNDG